MEIEIKTNNKNDLLHRTLIIGRLSFDAATPSNNEFSTELAKVLKGDVSLMVIKQILPDFGTKEASFKAYLYDSLEAKNKSERMTKHLKKQAEEAAKKDVEQENITVAEKTDTEKLVEETKVETAKNEPDKEESANTASEEKKVDGEQA
jgi:ribosomal protein S24E